MGRVIKFRAWDAKDKVMRNWDELILDKEEGDDYYTIGYKENECVTRFDHEQILEQFTGLLDKNGKEIYEGDIVELFHEGINADGTAIRSVFEIKDMINFHLEFTSMWADIGTIIGNIHEGGI